MSRYIQFPVADGQTMLIEVEETEISPEPGVVKAGIKDKLDDLVAVAQTTFETAVEGAVGKLAGDANYAIKLTWKDETKQP